jgi:hypothetical protein
VRRHHHPEADALIFFGVHEPRATELTLWTAAVDEPLFSPGSLTVVETSGLAAVVSLDGWDGEVIGQTRAVQYRRVVVGNLVSGRRYRFELRQDGRTLATATGDTLPDRLPGLDERPFTILLGSCFARQNDGGGELGRAYGLLPSGARPDLKVLCGDQVYLDGFGLQTIFTAVDPAGLTDRFIDSYAKAWGQDPGFGAFLRDGATLFSSDDHDYWNNAPNPSITAPQTFDATVRGSWWAIASQLVDAFQWRGWPPRRAFAIGQLSLYLADTRIERSPGRATFMSEPELAQLESWTRNLKGPGLLVVGQLVFAARAGWTGQFMDWGLPDFQEQYHRLVRALRTAPHSIVVLTGDVHYGRVANSQFGEGPEIIEIVASPLTLIFPFPPHTWKAAPGLFPADPDPNLPGWPIQTNLGYNIEEDHFATIEFAGAGGSVRMTVRAWPIHTAGLPPRATRQAEFRLQ